MKRFICQIDIFPREKKWRWHKSLFGKILIKKIKSTFGFIAPFLFRFTKNQLDSNFLKKFSKFIIRPNLDNSYKLRGEYQKRNGQWSVNPCLSCYDRMKSWPVFVFQTYCTQQVNGRNVFITQRFLNGNVFLPYISILWQRVQSIH